MLYLPRFVSELPDWPVTDCVPAAGLMGVNKASRGAYPATSAEREALQNAMGTQDKGAFAADLVKGVLARYQRTVKQGPADWTAIKQALTDPLQGIVLLGSYPALPAFIRNAGSQSTFNGGHAIYAQADGGGGIFVGDPLASRYYHAGAVPDDLFAYSAGLGHAWVGFTEDTLPDTGTGGMPVWTTTIKPTNLVGFIKAGASVLDAPRGKTLFKVTRDSAVTFVGMNDSHYAYVLDAGGVAWVAGADVGKGPAAADPCIDLANKIAAAKKALA